MGIVQRLWNCAPRPKTPPCNLRMLRNTTQAPSFPAQKNKITHHACDWHANARPDHRGRAGGACAVCTCGVDPLSIARGGTCARLLIRGVHVRAMSSPVDGNLEDHDGEQLGQRRLPEHRAERDHDRAGGEILRRTGGGGGQVVRACV